jgi:hypothetical protein
MCSYCKKQDDSCLWHWKFGHLNYPTLFEYYSNGQITRPPKLELIHSNVFGLLKVKSFNHH